MKIIKNTLLLVSGLIAIIPGFMILKTSIGVPSPDLESLFFGVLEATGCLAILLLLLNKEKIKTRTNDKKSKYTLLLFFLFILGLVIYIYLFNSCVIETPYSKGFFPLFLTDDLSREVLEAGGKIQFVEKWMTDGSKNIIQKTAGTSLSITVIIFLLIYTLTLTSLISSFVIASINIDDE
ncbi:hypothetical protein [Chryseobacterium lactis]|uniref:hypothetical protein n=1 Tax=Chryseobacterium lactis TaxID=1241981 RepID=UPI00063D1226|nr:hypothetical protein [Chryseobacterium lactis]